MSIRSLIHANIHRVKEGARVLEDMARFVLKDEILFKKTRALRHGLQTIPPAAHSQSDFGGVSFQEDNLRPNLIHLVQANVSRIQEALRVLEETSQDNIHKQKIKSLRFAAYDLQRVFYSKTAAFMKKEKLTGLYPVIDLDMVSCSIERITDIINSSAVQLVQLRCKSAEKRLFLKNAIKFKSLLDPEKLFIINDDLDIAMDIADGVHLGQNDYPAARARKLVPDHFVLGVSCHNMKEAALAEKAGASYLSVGCLFPTNSKKNVTPTSLDTLQTIQQNSRIPVCAIGGINQQNLAAILACQIKLVAVIAGIWQEPEPETAIESLQHQIESKKVEKKRFLVI